MPGTGLPIYSAGLDGAPVSFHFSSSGLARFFYDPNRFGLFLFTRGISSAEPLPRDRTNTCLCKGRGPQDPKKQTQSRPINPKQPGITQGFPALFSQLAFFKASFWETPCRGRGSLYIARGWMVHPFLFIFPLQGLPGARPQEDLQRRRPKADPKQTQSRPINPKQPGITQGFPALFSQLAFFKASFWETPCRGRGSLYIARGWMVHPFLFIFPLRGLPGARPQEDLQRRRPKADPKQTNQPKAAWNHPRLSGSILSTCLL